jgi:carbon-monoxide dehydrogenase medium subunit
VLEGCVVDAATMLATAQAAAAAIDAADDIDAPADYRRALVETLTGRALQRAVTRPH